MRIRGCEVDSVRYMAQTSQAEESATVNQLDERCNSPCKIGLAVLTRGSDGVGGIQRHKRLERNNGLYPLNLEPRGHELSKKQSWTETDDAVGARPEPASSRFLARGWGCDDWTNRSIDKTQHSKHKEDMAKSRLFSVCAG